MQTLHVYHVSLVTDNKQARKSPNIFIVSQIAEQYKVALFYLLFLKKRPFHTWLPLGSSFLLETEVSQDASFPSMVTQFR